MTWSSLAHEIGLPLPLVDSFINLSSILCDRDFIADGRTAAALGVNGRGVEGIRTGFVEGT